MKKLLVLVIVCMASVALWAGGAGGAVICVDPEGGGDYDNLQAALSFALDNSEADTIQVVQGVYNGNFIYSSSEGYSITLEGGYTAGCTSRVVDPTNTILDGGDTDRVLYLNDSGGGDMSVEGFTIRNGTTGGEGGGIYIYAHSSTGMTGDIAISNNIISGNVASQCGGGVYALLRTSSGTAGSIMLTDNIITENSAETKDGGGVYASSYSDSSGTASTITLTNNIITGNDASLFGGGVFAYSHSVSGAAGDVTLINNIIAGNFADTEGGGGSYAVSSSGSETGGTVTLTNNTITGNDTSDRGGGIFLYRDDNTINCYSNIIWGNTGTSGGDIYLAGPTGTSITNGYNNDYSAMSGSWTSQGDNDNFDPLVVAPGYWDDGDWVDGDYHLQPTSPCIDVGHDSAPGIPDYDFEGDSRHMDGDHNGTPIVDMGADELPTIWYVDWDIGTSGDGTSWGEAFETIDQAITAASAGDEIWVKEGTYDISSAQINVDKVVDIYGGFDGTETARSQREWETNTTTVDGGDAIYHCFYVTADATIDGFTITGGNADGEHPDNKGGGIYNGHCIPSIANCTLTGNSADYAGGGIHNLHADAAITNCTFSDNTITGEYGYGAAIHNVVSSPTISHCYFSGNEVLSGSGGAIFNHTSSAFITTCTFFDNTAQYDGGAIDNYYHTDPEPIITNCLFLANTATDGYGGAINTYQSSPIITNCTFSGNSVGDLTGPRGHAICNYYNDANPIITNCILWGDKLDDEILDGPGAASTVTYSCVWTSSVYPGTGNINDDPQFVGGGDYHLEGTSPCIDTGNNSAPEIPDYDFEGDPRIMYGTVDMGVDEYDERIFWYVKTDGSDPGDCTDGHSWLEAYQTIQKAIDCAAAGDEIWVKQGNYLAGATIDVDEVVAIYGGFDGTETARGQRDWANNTTIVDGNDTINHCLYVTADATIDGFTITGGNATGTHPDNCGGGIYNHNCNPSIANCTLTGNTADYGGAIYHNVSTATIIDCTFSGNTAHLAGGGIYNNNATPTIRYCTFTGNTANFYGGGIANNNSSDSTITDCTFTGNTITGTPYGGGGIDNNLCSPTISRCSFVGNTAYSGGGIRNDSASPTITNCLFYDNTATNLAGGIFNYDASDATITNCTVTKNTAGFGGAVANTASDPTFTNCILWGDSASTGAEIHIISGSPTFTYCDIEGGTGESWFGAGCIDIDPKFMAVTDPDPANWDLHLQFTSPCIDIGDNAAPEIPDYDFEGDSRIINGTVDMGADEALVASAENSYKLCPDGLDFGAIAVGGSHTMSLIMNNTTGAAIDVGTATSPSTPYTKTGDWCSDTTLNPDDICTIRVQFAPGSGGTYTDSFQIPTNDPEAGTVTVSLLGIAGGSAEPRDADAHPSEPGATGEPDGKVSGSAGDVTVPSVKDPSPGGKTASGQTPETPSAGEDTILGYPADAVISSLSPARQRGSEKQRLLEESQKPLDSMIFGEVGVGASDQLRIILSHEEGAAIKMGDIVLPSAPYMIVEDKCSGTLLGSGGACAVTVQFSPPSQQAFHDYFLIPTHDPEVGTLRINLEGTGVSE